MRKHFACVALALLLFMGVFSIPALAMDMETHWLPEGYAIQDCNTPQDTSGGYYRIYKQTPHESGTFMMGHSDDRLYGLVNSAGEIMIPIEYHDIDAPSQNLIVARKGDLYGYLNMDGTVAIPFQYESANSFKEDGTAMVKLPDTYWDYFYIDRTGKRVGTVNFTEGSGLIVYRRSEGVYSIWDKATMKEVFEIQAEACEAFYSGVAAICRDGKWGFIDRTGNLITPCQYGYLTDIFNPSVPPRFYNGLAKVGKDTDGDEVADIFTVIDTTGKELFPMGKYTPGIGSSITYFPNGFIELTDNATGRVGLADPEGRWIIPCEYDKVSVYAGDDGYFHARRELDSDSNTAEEYLYDKTGLLFDASAAGYGSVQYQDGLLLACDKSNPENWIFSLLNLNGELLHTFTDGSASRFVDGYSIVWADGNLVDKEKDPYLRWSKFGIVKNPLYNPTPVSATRSANLHITYNGVEQAFTHTDGGTILPLIYNGTTYLPVRAIAGLVGIETGWDGASNTVLLSTAGNGSVQKYSKAGTPQGTTETVTATTSRAMKVTLDGVNVDLKDANFHPIFPLIYQGTTYLPVGAVSDLMGLSVEWDGTTSTVKLTTK